MPRTIPKPFFLIPLAALLAILPLLHKGCSCGHDMVFHVQGWYDAASQLRHLHYPRWSFTSAWNAGEPRFLFYPPLSWLLGAVLTLIFPPNLAVSAFIFLTLTTAGLTFYKLASHFTTPNAALIASALYLANPYMLFNAFERSAFAELLAAAWIPLLLLAVLRHRPTIPSIALPLALLWLTNAPAAVMGSYALALLATLRVATEIALVMRRRNTPNPSLLPTHYSLFPASLTLTYILGTLLGLALPAFYLIPAAYERRFIQVEMAIIPTMRIQDNFLFSPTQDPGHNGVNLQISLLAVTLLTLTIAAVLTLLILHIRTRKTLTHKDSVILSCVSRGPMRETQPKDLPLHPSPAIGLALLTAALTLMLLPISTPIWNHLPELAFLQFPWRLLTLLSAVLVLSIALLLNRGNTKPSPSAQAPGVPCTPSSPHGLSQSPQKPSPPLSSILYALPSALLLGLTAFRLYAQFCQPTDRPPAIAHLLRDHYGFPPTDEYTPNNADSDVLRTTNPAYWLLPADANPNTPAPNTVPTAVELNPNLDTDANPVPLDQRLSTPAPQHLTLTLPQPQTLVLNLRNYPNWDVTGCGEDTMACEHYPGPPRDDGLITLQLPPGQRRIDITWRTTPDQRLGLAISAIALLLLFWFSFRSEPKEPASSPATIPTR